MSRDVAKAMLEEAGMTTGQYFFRAHEGSTVGLTVAFKNKATHHAVFLDFGLVSIDEFTPHVSLQATYTPMHVVWIALLSAHI